MVADVDTAAAVTGSAEPAPAYSPRAVLEASSIAKSYRRRPLRRRHTVLRGADLTLYPGEVVGLVGPHRRHLRHNRRAARPGFRPGRRCIHGVPAAIP
jgi:hypothetical protein